MTNITFKSIEYKNFLSTGNSENKIELNKDKTTLIVGKNGHGKCVHRGTMLPIMFYHEGRKIEINCAISVIADLFRQYPYSMPGAFYVNGRKGYHKILHAGLCNPIRQRFMTIRTTKKHYLRVGLDHLLLSKRPHDNKVPNWKAARKLKAGDILYTEHGEATIKSMLLASLVSDLHDIQVENVEEYYADGIVVHNSTMLDVVTFSLFGKPFRDIAKAQLINSINGKNCVTKIDFDVNKIPYSVIRGMKPSIFEIYKNDELINQDASVRDYQKVLEDHILKLNYKTFTQVVILGSASFVPFMQLPTAQRRDVIEDILDIKVFSDMNKCLKEKISQTKNEILSVNNELRLIENSMQSNKNLIHYMENVKSSNLEKLLDDIEDNKAKFTTEKDKGVTLFEDIKILESKLNDYGKSSVMNSIQHHKIEIANLERIISNCNSNNKFYDNHDNCPTCNQPIDSGHKSNCLQSNEDTIKDCNDKIQTIHKIELEKLNEQLNVIRLVESEINDKKVELSNIKNSILMYKNQIDKLSKEAENLKVSNENIEGERCKLYDLEYKLSDKTIEVDKLNDDRQIQDYAISLLKDDGIKSTIIKDYIPIMNKFINDYLNIFDLYVQFTLDESFNESIKSRHRDDFTYASFSEGEKKKLDIAILFAWRQIAKMKNSCNTNLLLMDEVCDSSLDHASLECFMQLLKTLDKDMNAFIISHREDTLSDKFDNVISFKKVNDFSIIEN